MKTLKILSFIILLVFLVIFIRWDFTYSDLTEDLNAYARHMGSDGFQWKASAAEYLEALENLELAASLFSLSVLVFPLISFITAITNRKKYYGGFISGFFVLIPFLLSLWAFRLASFLASAWKGFAYNMGLTHYNAFLTYALVFSIPVTIHFADAIIKTIRHKQGKDIPDASKKSDVEVLADKLIQNLQPQNAAPAPASVPASASAAVEIKQYKELLDMGAITQEEFEAKKKQLLGLPVAGGAPAAPQNVGRCVSCGRENVPVETVDVVVAGAVRKRTMCKDCAARYK